MKKKVRSGAASARSHRDPKAGAPGNGARGRSRADPAIARWFARASKEFAQSRASTIPLLQSAQAALGYLPPEAIESIARHVGVAPAVVEGVASFYAQFRFEKPGRHRVTVCGGTACYVRGSGKLMENLQADLKVVPGHTTADGKVTLESVSCFGACALAPVVVVDGKVNGRVHPSSLKSLIGGATQGGRRVKARA